MFILAEKRKNVTKNSYILLKLLKVNSLIDKIISLIKIKGDQVKLELISKFSTFLALSILFFTLVILSLLMLIFLSLGIAVIFNEFLMSAYWGYFIASAFFFLMIIMVVWMIRSGKIQNWLEEAIIESSYKKKP
jgi:hypothetical protein|tara:strand:+ start:53 stop:454 length:402 start_codon:yes stop_codon:yes gene_type:complete